VAGAAPHVDALVTARLDLFQVIVDIAEHSEHFTSPVLIRISVGGKIVCAEWFAFLSLVAKRTTNSQCSGEANHHWL
jgi:hypothetical protein